MILIPHILLTSSKELKTLAAILHFYVQYVATFAGSSHSHFRHGGLKQRACTKNAGNGSMHGSGELWWCPGRRRRPAASSSSCHLDEERVCYTHTSTHEGSKGVIWAPSSIPKYLTHLIKKIKIIYYFNESIVYYIIYFNYILDFFNNFNFF
jgi:hypothetical protein